VQRDFPNFDTTDNPNNSGNTDGTNGADPAASGQPQARRRRKAEPPPATGGGSEPETAGDDSDGNNDTADSGGTPKDTSEAGAADAAGAQQPPQRKSAAEEIRGLRKVGGFREQSKVKREQLVIPACKPQPTWWVRVHPDPDYTREVFTIELKDKRQTFLILDDDLPEELMGEKALKMKRLAVAITRQGGLFIWEAAAPWDGDRGGLWTQTICEAIDAAREEWIRVTAGEMAYEIQRPNGVLPEPSWPDCTYESLLTKAYQGRVIKDYDHPVLRELRGEV
jgi:hypothetical protein